MSLLSELNTLLEKIPLWKRLQTMPKEIDELRDRIAVLESSIKSKGDDACPRCHEKSFALDKTEADPTFGDLGVQRRVYKCTACGHVEYKQLT